MSKHTPGPWEFDGEYVWSNSIRGYVANPQTDDMTSGYRIARKDADEQIEANGFLIAAAPELLEALEAAVECGMVPSSSVSDGGANKHSIHVQVADKIRSAIAKAKGEK